MQNYVRCMLTQRKINKHLRLETQIYKRSTFTNNKIIQGQRLGALTSPKILRKWALNALNVSLNWKQNYVQKLSTSLQLSNIDEFTV